MPKKFIILTQARTGSEFVSHLLNSHPLVRCHTELFSHVTGHPERFNSFTDQVRAAHGDEAADNLAALVPAYLDAVFSEQGMAAVGFKLLLNQLHKHPPLAPWLLDQGVHVIQLIRDNALKVLLSRTRAGLTQVWHTSEKTPQTQVALPAGDKLIKELDAIASVDRQIAAFAAQGSHSVIHYEDVAQAPRDALMPVLLALNLPPSELTSPTRKINTLPLDQAIANYDEVAETLRGTDHERFLEQDKAASPASGYKPLVFLHIPKAGGSTLENVLRKNHGEESVFMAYGHLNGSIEEYACLSLRDKMRFEAVSGHFTYIYNPVLPSSSRYFCILRHPIERIVSNYYMYFHHKNHPMGFKIRDNNVTLDQFAAPGSGFNQDNVQVKYVAGVPLDAPCTQEHLDRALDLLLGGTIEFGILELYKESIFHFARLFGWQRLDYVHAAKNVKKPARETLDKALLAKVTALNVLDMQLYAAALERFQETVAALHREHGPELDAYLAQDVRVSEAKLHHAWRDK